MHKSVLGFRKALVAAALVLFSVLCASSPHLYAQGQMGPLPPESLEDLQKIDSGAGKGPMPNDEFRAIAQAQVEAIAFMCDVYYLHKNEYPVDIYQLIASPYWIADINNVLTGEAIQQVMFTPGEHDFVPDPFALYLDELQKSQAAAPPPSSPPPLPPAGSAGGDQGGTGTGGDQGNNGQNGQSQGQQGSSGAMPETVDFTPRLDPMRIGAVEPGNVLFYPQKSKSLQLIIWMTNDCYVDYYQLGPSSLSLARNGLVKMVRPSDDLVLGTAVLLEHVLPRAYGRWQFMAGQDPLLPRDLPGLTWTKRKEIFQRLQIFPRNPITRRPIDLVKAFDPGMVADLGTDGVPPVYCMEDGRMRTLRELTDKEYLAKNQSAIIARERAFKGQ